MGVKWWRVALAAAPAIILAVVLPDKPVVAFAAGIVGLSVITSTDDGESGAWFDSSWEFAKQILPLLLIGVLLAGIFLGRPGEERADPVRMGQPRGRRKFIRREFLRLCRRRFYVFCDTHGGSDSRRTDW